MPRVRWEWFAGWCVISVAWHCWSCLSLLQLFMPALSARCGVACVLRLRGALIPKNKQKKYKTQTHKKNMHFACVVAAYMCVLPTRCPPLVVLVIPCQSLLAVALCHAQPDWHSPFSGTCGVGLQVGLLGMCMCCSCSQ
jgi:hypothetical protein